MYFNSISIVPKLNAKDDPRVLAIIRLIEQCAAAADVPVVGNEIPDRTLFIAVGGDGTMLEAMRRASIYGGYALGINLGRIGFLSDINLEGVSLDDVKQTLMRIVGADDTNNAFAIEKRSVLVNSINYDIAVNDISVSSLESDEMIKYHLKVDDINAGYHRANSLLMATATGSTAYALAAGGALLMPDMASIQVVPVAPATLTSRPLVVSSRSEVTVSVVGKGVSVRMDGQRVFRSEQEYTADAPFEIKVSCSVYAARVIHLPGWNFFDVLSTKLGWIKE